MQCAGTHPSESEKKIKYDSFIYKSSVCKTANYMRTAASSPYTYCWHKGAFLSLRKTKKKKNKRWTLPVHFHRPLNVKPRGTAQPAMNRFDPEHPAEAIAGSSDPVNLNAGRGRRSRAAVRQPCTPGVANPDMMLRAT
jgi:hypothetical protein